MTAKISIALAGKRILVLEDEFLVALDVSASLESAGAFVVGPAYDLKTAIALATKEPLDGALLDVNIKGDNSLSVANVLKDRGIPFVFATGYGAIPSEWPSGPVVDKPYTAARMELAFTELFRSLSDKNAAK